MRISEFAVLTESISGKDIFVKQFVNELVDYINSMGKSGHPVKMMDYMRAYFQRYNMQLSSQQREMLRQACTEVDNEYNYFISKQQKPGAKPAQKPAPNTNQQSAGNQAFDQMATQLGGKPQSQGNQAFDQMAAQLYKGSPAAAPAAATATPTATPTEPTPTPQGPSALSAHMMPSQAALAAKKQKANAAYYGLDDRIEPTMEGVMGDIWNSVKSKASTLAGSFLSKLGLGSVNKLANLAYTILMTQPSLAQQGQGSYGRGYSSGMGGYGGQMRQPSMARQPRPPKATQAVKPQKDVQVTPQVQQIVKSIKAMKGPEFEADLTQIIKAALWNLYGGNKTAYNDAVNKLFGKQPTQQAEPQAEPENLGGKNAFNQMANSLRTNPMKVKSVKQPVPHPADDNPNIGLGSNE